MRGLVASLSLVILQLCVEIHAKHVFAHYMVGTVSEAHAHQDIDDAKGMGIDGFALNIGDPYQPFVDTTLHDLFGYAEYLNSVSDTPFYLYLSLDVYASGAACYAGSTSCNGPWDYADILTWTLGSSAYYTGDNTPNGFPMISTFSSGGFSNQNWTDWKASLANQMYFIPDFDETTGYYGGKDSYDGWYYYWGDVVDGLFSWESAWPKRGNPSPGTVGGSYYGDIQPDLTVQEGATARNKTYMMGLSPLQYKNSYGTNVYRGGDIQMFIRMVNLLYMETPPDWVVLQTWNDGPESHYIGNIWPEQNTDRQPAAYMGTEWSHKGWQPLITAFINAYKSGGDYSNMVTPEYEGVQQYAQGALWYKTILQGVTCINDDGNIDSTGAEQYWEKPDGFDSVQEEVNWAIVMPEGTSDYTISIWSGDTEILSGHTLGQGLNYGSVPQLNSGLQKLQILDPIGKVFMTATGGRCVSDGCPDFIYNMNYQVIPLVLGDADGSCSSSSTSIYAAPSIWTDPDAIIQCIPPCAIILPPLDLGYTTTINFPALTTSIWSLEGQNTVIKTITLDVPPLIASAMPFWRITLTESEATTATILPLQSFMPPSVTLTLSSNEATFAPVPQGSSQVSPVFYASSRPVTIQPQATVSIPVASPTVPDVIFMSAVPTAVCTTGCGTDSCSQFGGCNSDGSSSCGSDGCNGGCNFQTCDTTCGLYCSTYDDDVGYDESEYPDDPATNPTDDSQDSPNPIDPSVVEDIKKTNAQNLKNTYSAGAAWSGSPSDTSLQSAASTANQKLWDDANSAYNTLPEGAQQDSNAAWGVVESCYESAHSESTTSNPDDSTVLNFLNSVDDFAEYIEEYMQALSEEAYKSECSVAKRLARRELGKRDPCPGGPGTAGSIVVVTSPVNWKDIPDEMDCYRGEDMDALTVGATHTRENILGAIIHAIRYCKDNVDVAWNAEAGTWSRKGKWTTKSSYPHFYGNKNGEDGVSIDLGISSCVQSDKGGAPLLEFPILASGELLSASRKIKAQDARVGNDRVVFQFNGTSGESVFCGLMSHRFEGDNSFIPCKAVE